MAESHPSPQFKTPASTTAQGPDIAGCNQAEAALRTNAAPYQTILEDLTEVICRFKTDGTITYANGAFCRFFGKMSQELVGEKWQPRAAAEDVPMIEAQLRALSPTNPVVVVENRVYAGSGELRWMQFVNRGFFDAAGRLVETQAVGRDITERKRLQETLQERERLYRALVETTGTGYVIIDMEGKVLDANPEYVRLSGHRDLNEIRGRNVIEWTADYERAKNAEAVAQCAKEGYIRNLELDYVDAHDKFTTVDVNATVVNDDGSPRILSLCRDITERKRLQKTLQESERLYRAAEKMARLGHWERNHKTGTATWSEGLCDVFGLPSGSAPSRFEEFLDFVHPEDRAPLSQTIKAALASGQAFDAEFRIQRPDGELRYVHSRGMPARDASGEFNILSGTVQDITERKRVEKALRESAERYRSLVTSSMDAVLLTAPDGCILAANEAACRMFGRSEQELIQVGRSGVINGSDSRLAPALEERARKGRFRGELTLMRKDGTRFPGEVSSACFTNRQGKLFTSMVIRDITERKRMEEALRESEASSRARADELETLLAAAPALIFIAHDPDCRKMTSSDATLRLLRLPAGANSSKSAPPGKRPETFRALKDGRELRPEELPVQLAAASGQPVENFELTLAFEDGTSRDIVGDAIPLFDAEGKVRGAVGAFLDITERKRAEERTRRLARELLVVREKERQQVSSALHHDVGSLAVGIPAHLDAIEEDIRCRKLDEALKLMKRTRKLFDESVARLKGLATQLRPPELDVLGLRAALREHFSQATECGHTRIHFRETLGRRRVDEGTATILFRVAQEALTNAIRHGGAKRVDVSLRALKKKVRLIVRDNGTGFDPSEGRVQQTSQIGLHVMQQMVIHAGGACLIDSTPGKGTTVRVSLPLRCGVAGASGNGRNAGGDSDGR